MTGAFQPWHWIVLILVVVLLFGSKKLPDAARGLGRSLRIFKSEVKEMQNDGKDTNSTTTQTAQTTQQPVAPAQLPAQAPVASPDPTVQTAVPTDQDQHPRSA